MVSCLNSPGKKKNLKRVAVARTKEDTTVKGRRAPPLIQEIGNPPSSLHGLETGNTMTYHEILGVLLCFMDVDPREWPENKTYQNALPTVECLRVVNDIAERGVALAEEYTDNLASGSDHKQAVYEVVHRDRLERPMSSKKV